MPPILQQSQRLANHRSNGFAGILALAILIVLALASRTNHMKPEWDTKYYVDMARNGVIRNRNLVAPFAYRPGAPLLIGAIARALKLDAEKTFRVCAAAFSVAFILCCFYFARSAGASNSSAMFSSVVLALYFYIVKWALFAGAMVDIYAYPVILLAFWALIQRRFYTCLLVSAVGLYFKEFLLLPMLTQIANLAIETRRQHWKKIFKPLALTALVLTISFVVPRLLIHVVGTEQDIDPLNRPSTLWRLFLYPANGRRDFNILFAYMACWLPVLLLLSSRRVQIVWERLQPYRSVVLLYMALHFALVMYGGTNLIIFVTYSLPVQILVLTIVLEAGGVQVWEKIAVLVVVILFNRLWMYIPLPQRDLSEYLNFYGGYHMLVTRRSLLRMAELTTWILGFWFIRMCISKTSGRLRHPTTAQPVL